MHVVQGEFPNPGNFVQDPPTKLALVGKWTVTETGTQIQTLIFCFGTLFDRIDNVPSIFRLFVFSCGFDGWADFFF